MHHCKWGDTCLEISRLWEISDKRMLIPAGRLLMILLGWLLNLLMYIEFSFGFLYRE